jgi:hypothetical protein
MADKSLHPHPTLPGHWLQKAVPESHRGIETDAAKRAGESLHAYAEANKNDPGTAGKRARFALEAESHKFGG